MRATTIHGPYDIRVEDVPDPRVEQPDDAVVHVLRACVCGSDLWAYRGQSARVPGQRIGHEFVGTVVATGSRVRSVRPGDLVLAPFTWSDGACVFCTERLPTSCTNGGMWGAVGSDGGQGEGVRVPFADGTLVKVPAGAASDERLLRGLLALTDVMGTGHHAAVSAGARPGATVAVVGDGAVGLCAVLAARLLGAEHVIALGRHPDRLRLAREFGAADTITERGEAAVTAVREATGGHGVHAAIEAVGSAEAMRTAVGVTRPGGAIGWVGAPHGSGEGLDVGALFMNNLTLRGGIAPVRSYIPELLPRVLDGTLDPSPVFDSAITLESIADGYRAMDERSALKVLVTPT
ncbi:zinc-dependent alcohol dehydrogenase family protein [Embleya hyalina]|uniref:IMP dehydrogenase n=1 Tax=Embleya hyalina TaxID=516124 RepID=A0A401YM86_9ACTN|nr:zinc-dependent alcohol dehydrogenase family protein [Embleya hyalina]GCD95722.1 IMP dehydrogenase [Embleya hyalina]